MPPGTSTTTSSLEGTTRRQSFISGAGRRKSGSQEGLVDVSNERVSGARSYKSAAVDAELCRCSSTHVKPVYGRYW